MPKRQYTAKMQITLFQGLLVSVVTAIISIDSHLEGFFWFRPIIVAPVTGLILGDLHTGLIAGGYLELIFAGLNGVGGTIPPDSIMAAVMTVVLAKTTNLSVEAAVASGYGFGLLMQAISTLVLTGFLAFNKPADNYAAKADIKGITRLCWIGIIIGALQYGILTFLSVYAAQDAMRNFAEILEVNYAWVLDGFSIAGGLLPAIGFAMLLKVMLKVQYFPYLLAGFLFSTFIPYDNILPVALMGVAFAMMSFFNDGEAKGGAVYDEEGI